jgi:uncharacterized protein (DUF1697 family)
MRSAAPRQSYIIWFSQRVGSTLLAQALEDTGIVGHPREWFNAPSASSVLASHNVSTVDELRDVLWRDAQTTNGVLGIKYGMVPKLHEELTSMFGALGNHGQPTIAGRTGKSLYCKKFKLIVFVALKSLSIARGLPPPFLLDIRCDNSIMALIVFFRGINVGGHRAFRPSVLAKELGIYDVVNVGAAGTLVVRKPGLRVKFLSELRRTLPFEATIAFCYGSDLIRLEMDNPFGAEPPRADVVQFVSILSEAGRRKVSLPIALPERGEWLVRIIGSKNRLVYGVYRRHMKTIRYLGQIDRLFGAPATTRSWNTILSVLRILKSHKAVK